MAAQRTRLRPGNLVPCSKQRCTGPATHVFSFDYQAKTVFLADYEGSLPFGAQVLCLRHAESFTIPIGWLLDDQRRREQPLFVQTPESTAPRHDEDHPAMRGRRGIEVRRRPDLPGGYVPDDEHPSGPLDVDERNEPSDITRQIDRFAHDLAGGEIADGLVDYWDDDSTFGDGLDADDVAPADEDTHAGSS